MGGLPLVAERNHTQKRGWWQLGGGFFFNNFYGGFGAIFGVLWAIFALLVAAAGKRIGSSLFFRPRGLLGAAGTKIVRPWLLGGDFVALYGRPWAKSHARDSRHTGGVGSPQTSEFRHCPGGGLTQPQPPNLGGVGGWWVVGESGAPPRFYFFLPPS